MRDRLVHDYIGINYSIVWDVIKNKIPELYIQIQEVIEKNKKLPLIASIFNCRIVGYVCRRF